MISIFIDVHPLQQSLDVMHQGFFFLHLNAKNQLHVIKWDSLRLSVGFFQTFKTEPNF